MIFHWSLMESKSCILAELTYIGVLTVSTCLLLSTYSRPFCNPLGNVPSSPTTIGINVNFMIHSFLKNFLGRYLSLSLFGFLLVFLGSLLGQQNPQFGRSYLFVYYPKVCSSNRSVCIPKSLEILCVLSVGWIPGFAYTTCLNISNFNLLYNSLKITFLIQSNLVI